MHVAILITGYIRYILTTSGRKPQCPPWKKMWRAPVGSPVWINRRSGIPRSTNIHQCRHRHWKQDQVCPTKYLIMVCVEHCIYLPFLTSLLFHRFLMGISCTTSPPQIFLHCQRTLCSCLTAVLPWWERNWNRWGPCLYYRLVGCEDAELVSGFMSPGGFFCGRFAMSEVRGGSEDTSRWDDLPAMRDYHVSRNGMGARSAEDFITWCSQNWARTQQIGLSWAVLFWAVWREAN